ncbi:basic proline-rich protein-like [Ammospiza caudacuta]|uniref:basic proline-rich protein-like n=1 Tax=Ammospiza caudacuta TaxID=2857398 RepID=UPI002739338C|nr:basic proline-rich protein-like [Ammospiza caudacuta]
MATKYPTDGGSSPCCSCWNSEGSKESAQVPEVPRAADPGNAAGLDGSRERGCQTSPRSLAGLHGSRHPGAANQREGPDPRGIPAFPERRRNAGKLAETLPPFLGDRVPHPPGVRSPLPMHPKAMPDPPRTLRGMPRAPRPRTRSPEQRLTGQPSPGRAAARRRAVLSGHGAAPRPRGLRLAWPGSGPGSGPGSRSRRRRARRRGGERGEGRARRCRLGPGLLPPPPPSPSPRCAPPDVRPQMCAPSPPRGRGREERGSRRREPLPIPTPPSPPSQMRPPVPAGQTGGSAPAAPRTALRDRPSTGLRPRCPRTPGGESPDPRQRREHRRPTAGESEEQGGAEPGPSRPEQREASTLSPVPKNSAGLSLTLGTEVFAQNKKKPHQAVPQAAD